jgi:hypothetical protein
MRPVDVTVGPVGTVSATNIATSQTPAAAGSTYTCTFTNASATITVTNTLVVGAPISFKTTGQLPYPLVVGQTYYVVTQSGTTLTVSGNYGGTAIVMTTSAVGSPGFPNYFPAAAGTQSVVYGGYVALNGSLVAGPVAIASLGVAQRVLITTADTTHTFTVNGLTATGAFITETVGPITTSAYTQQDFYQVTSIAINGLATAAVTVGTNGIAATGWVKLDAWAPGPVSIQCDVTGTVNFTVQSTLDNDDSTYAPVLPQNLVWINTNDTSAVNATASLQTNYQFAPTFVRCLLNSGSGSVKMVVTQLSVVPY